MTTTNSDSRLGPFVSGEHYGYSVGAITTEDRIRMVQKFNLDQCRQALAMPHLQKTVRTAVERRIRKLEASI